jgi:hypothetical protein
MTAQQFNEKYPIGTPFTYFSIKGMPSTAKDVETTSDAWEIGGGDAIVKVSGVSGGVSVEHLEEK